MQALSMQERSVKPRMRTDILMRENEFHTVVYIGFWTFHCSVMAYVWHLSQRFAFR